MTSPAEHRLARPFSDLRIVEVAGSVAGAYAGKFFSDQGALVLKVEPPGGDPLRWIEPLLERGGALFSYTNTGKRSLVLDLDGSGADRRRLFELIAGADVVIESSSPGPLRPVTGELELPQLVKVYVSPFGLDGPYADFSSSDFTDFAISGHMFINGDPDRPPLQGPPHESEYCAGIYAFIGAVAALLCRERTGRGQTIDLSHFEVMVSLDQYLVTEWTHSHHLEGRVGNATPGPWHPNIHLAARDGEVSITAGSAKNRESMLRLIGLGALLDDPRFSTTPALLAHRDEFTAAIAPWFADRDVAEIVEVFRLGRVPAAPVRGLHDVLDYEQLRARGYWAQPEGPNGPRYASGPFVVAGRPASVSPAPMLGDADDEVLSHFSPSTSDGSGEQPGPSGPLDGLQVLDLGAGWAGPMCGRILGDLGADVIRIEPPWGRGPRRVSKEFATAYHLYPDDDPGGDPWNREGMAALWGRNRRSVCLDLKSAEGHQILEELVGRSDLLLENFTPRVLPKMGLFFGRLQELNPSLVYLHLPGYGSTGPDADNVALGPTIEAAAGICALSGYSDRTRHRQGYAFPDAINGMCGAAAALVGLWHRASDQAHRGVDVEGAQLEATVCFGGSALLAAQANGTEPPLRGNRHEHFAPQGVYPAAGTDSWIAITVRSEPEWRALSRLVRMPKHLAVLSSPGERMARHDEIDESLSLFTARHDHRELMRSFQDVGITACAVLNASELVEDPHLTARGLWQMLSGSGCGPYPSHGLPLHFSQTPPTYRIQRAELGEHNAEVLAELGRSPQEIASLIARRVVVNCPPEDMSPP